MKRGGGGGCNGYPGWMGDLEYYRNFTKLQNCGLGIFGIEGSNCRLWVSISGWAARTTRFFPCCVKPLPWHAISALRTHVHHRSQNYCFELEVSKENFATSHTTHTSRLDQKIYPSMVAKPWVMSSPILHIRQGAIHASAERVQPFLRRSGTSPRRMHLLQLPESAA